MREWLVILAVAAVQQAASPPKPVVVVFETELGAITMEVDVARAPVSATNFLRYVDGRFYDGGQVHRAVRPDNTVRHDVEIEIIQFSINGARRREEFPSIPLERTSVTGLRHVDGTLSMARNGPDTATSSFSIIIGNQPSLDFGGKRNADGQGFAAFGRVTAGMDVVRKIQASRTRPGTETLDPPITVVRAYRKTRGIAFAIRSGTCYTGSVCPPFAAPSGAARFRNPSQQQP